VLPMFQDQLVHSHTKDYPPKLNTVKILGTLRSEFGASWEQT